MTIQCLSLHNLLMPPEADSEIYFSQVEISDGTNDLFAISFLRPGKIQQKIPFILRLKILFTGRIFGPEFIVNKNQLLKLSSWVYNMSEVNS